LFLPASSAFSYVPVLGRLRILVLEQDTEVVHGDDVALLVPVLGRLRILVLEQETKVGHDHDFALLDDSASSS
jgi:hypothetical protein